MVPAMAGLRTGSKCSHITYMLRFLTVSRLAMNPDLYFEIASNLPMWKYPLLATRVPLP
jgi:hypothetical protein